MNTLTKMIAVLLASILLISGITAAQDASDEQVQDDKSINAKELDVAREQAEIAAREAKKQAEIAQRQAAANIRQAELALAKVKSASSVASPVVPSAGYSTISRSRWPFQSSGASPVLVIPSAEIETKDLLTINEDLNVMSRIFEPPALRRLEAACFSRAIMLSARCWVGAEVLYKASIYRITDHCF